MSRRAHTVSADEVRRDLERFERLYEISSQEFLRRWETGALDDRLEFFEWIGVCRLAMKMGLLAQPQQQHGLSCRRAENGLVASSLDFGPSMHAGA